MDWPNPQDYNEVIQNPAICFADPDLKDSRIELSAIGLPRPITGAFASVYKLHAKERTLALRCFHNDVPDLEERYNHILAAHEQLKAAWLPKTEFVQKGIKVNGRWFPVIKMDWLDGMPLDRYLANVGSNEAKLKKVAQDFRAILDDLQAAGIAHGDLQHGNILMVGDEIKLIDYDGMFVPALDGMKSAELGHPNYQHPYRSRDHFGPYLDNFPAWLITVSLLCIAADPELLKYSRDRECLLFAHADLLTPHESAVFAALKEHPQEEIRNAAQTLMKLLNTPIEFVPFLDATEAYLDDMPELDPGDRMRLMEQLSKTDVERFADQQPIIKALEGLSAKKIGPKDRLSQFFRMASTKSESLITNVLSQLLTAEAHATRADTSFSRGQYKDAIDSYVKALEHAMSDKDKRTALHERQRQAELKVVSNPATRTNFARFQEDTNENLRFQDHLNLRLAVSHLLNNNPGASVFYYKTVINRRKLDKTADALLEATAGLLVAHCQLNRVQDAKQLFKESCLWKGKWNTNNPEFAAKHLSMILLDYSNSPLGSLSGLCHAITVAADFHQYQKRYDDAASLYQAARSVKGAQNLPLAQDRELLLTAGHCYLLSRRPDLALGCFNSIANTPDQDIEALRDRAAIGQAVAFKMMNSRQDVAKAMRSRMPEQLYNCFKLESEGLLGSLEEFTEVVVAFAAELGDSNLMDGVRLATRLAADNYKQLDDNRRMEEVLLCLKNGDFARADELVDDEILGNEDLKANFIAAAQAAGKNLAVDGQYEEAFKLLTKYRCNYDVVIDAMEGKVIKHIKSASRQMHWSQAEFNQGLAILEQLCANYMLSDDLSKFLTEAVLASMDRSDNFLNDVRRLADFMALNMRDGASNANVLKLRQFAVMAEEPYRFTSIPRPDASPTKLGQFVRGAQVASVSAKSHKMEVDVLAVLKQASQSGWDLQKVQDLRMRIEDMKKQRCLTPQFCDQLAESLLDHFSELSALNRWKENTGISRDRKDEVKIMVNSLMDTFAALPGIQASTLRTMQRCVQKL